MRAQARRRIGIDVPRYAANLTAVAIKLPSIPSNQVCRARAGSSHFAS